MHVTPAGLPKEVVRENLSTACRWREGNRRQVQLALRCRSGPNGRGCVHDVGRLSHAKNAPGFMRDAWIASRFLENQTVIWSRIRFPIYNDLRCHSNAGCREY
jgi:hypothetical protein